MANKTMVKNGKRMPISEAGKGKGSKGKPAKKSQAAKTHNGKPTPPASKPGKITAEDRAKAKQELRDRQKAERAQRKAELKSKAEKQVKKLTEFSKVVAEQAKALVDFYDENEQKAAELKERIGGLKGMISQDKEELRKLAREVKSRGRGEKEDADAARRMASVEQDIERREVELASLVEWRQGYREAMKACMDELRKLIKDKAAGALLFDQNKDRPARSAEEVGTANAGKPDPSPASASARENTGSTNESGAPGSVDRPKVGKVYSLTRRESGVVLDAPVKVERINDDNAITIDAASGRGRAQLPIADFAWTEVIPEPVGA